MGVADTVVRYCVLVTVVEPTVVPLTKDVAVNVSVLVVVVLEATLNA